MPQHFFSNVRPVMSARVSATGVITELDHSFQVVKKLKLVGYPHKVSDVTVCERPVTLRQMSFFGPVFCAVRPGLCPQQ